MRQNAPHLVSELPLIVPSYSWWEGPFYGIGLKLYQVLSGKYGFGSSQLLSKEETMKRLPSVNPEGLTGGVVYYDGQFDDTRLLINLIATAAEQGATLLNYAKVTELNKGADGLVNGVAWQNVETGEKFSAQAKVVINATGTFTDSVRRLAEPEADLMAPEIKDLKKQVQLLQERSQEGQSLRPRRLLSHLPQKSNARPSNLQSRPRQPLFWPRLLVRLGVPVYLPIGAIAGSDAPRRPERVESFCRSPV